MLEFHCKWNRGTFHLNVELSVPTGSICALFGPSAAGKTTILKAMAGFLPDCPDASLQVDGEWLMKRTAGRGLFVPAWKRRLMYVEQGAQLFPHLTVAQNIFYGTPDLDNSHKVSWMDPWLEEFGLRPYLHRLPRELSGGLVQRAVIARAIANRPRVLLLDEPFSALDEELRRVLQDAVLHVQRELCCTVLLVTHQLTEAQRMADTICMIVDGETVQIGKPEELMNEPRTFQNAQLLGYTHLLRDSAGRRFAFHPSRVIFGEHPHLGPVQEGMVLGQFPHQGERRVRVQLADGGEIVELSTSIAEDIQVGQSVRFTAVRPPYFRPDGLSVSLDHEPWKGSREASV
ncbi:MAG: ABC transporter ATP-binding protein [Alicyclobacillaceae bacterium]|nr:ABC transporter ATP-binding protein [Alicyclobacillaceae bacterium]MCY0895387.1 ABC transporter ATP-binding protein [Alicyclobacillaceae bacterium]